MDEFISVFGSGFSLLWNAQLLGVPVLFWFVIVGVFAIIGQFIRGKKD